MTCRCRQKLCTIMLPVGDPTWIFKKPNPQTLCMKKCPTFTVFEHVLTPSKFKRCKTFRADLLIVSFCVLEKSTLQQSTDTTGARTYSSVLCGRLSCEINSESIRKFICSLDTFLMTYVLYGYSSLCYLAETGHHTGKLETWPISQAWGLWPHTAGFIQHNRRKKHECIGAGWHSNTSKEYLGKFRHLYWPIASNGIDIIRDGLGIFTVASKVGQKTQVL